MEATLKFNLPDEAIEFNNAVKGGRALSALFDTNQMFRNLLKHGEPDKKYKTPSEAIEDLWEKFRFCLEENEITTLEL